MKSLLEDYLTQKGIIFNSYNEIILNHNASVSFNDKTGEYEFNITKWRYNCEMPSFTDAEIRDYLKAEYIQAHTEHIQYKYSDDKTTQDSKINDLNSLTEIEDIKNFII
jgi:hypothetical protein